MLLKNQGMEQLLLVLLKNILQTQLGKKGWIKPIKILREIDQSIGIIGAGPAGLACAEELKKIRISSNSL